MWTWEIIIIDWDDRQNGWNIFVWQYATLVIHIIINKWFICICFPSDRLYLSNQPELTLELLVHVYMCQKDCASVRVCVYFCTNPTSLVSSIKTTHRNTISFFLLSSSTYEHINTYGSYSYGYYCICDCVRLLVDVCVFNCRFG